MTKTSVRDDLEFKLVVKNAVDFMSQVGSVNVRSDWM